MSYTHLAAVYDQLMADTPYDAWLDWLEREWARHGRPQTVIDLGCGTGSIAIPLAKRGYQVTGVDLSPEMLAIAHEKMKQAHVNVRWVEQDMRELDVPAADAVISFCDSLSYLTDELDVKETFRRVYAHLRPGGTFLFDVHSPYKMLHIFADNTFTHLGEEIAYIWHCFCDPLRYEVEHELTFFVRQSGGHYLRLEESQVQRAYQPLSIIHWLKEAGFTDIVLSAEYGTQPPQEQSERLFFAARRP